MNLPLLNHAEICQLIPHAGGMCLLDRVIAWDTATITCATLTHRRSNNPLRNTNGLPMSALIEYAAQAMAVHGCLLTKDSGTVMQEGYLAALRDVKLRQGWLSDIDVALLIKAERLFVDGGNMIYNMSASAQGQELMAGRASVVAKFVSQEAAI